MNKYTTIWTVLFCVALSYQCDAQKPGDKKVVQDTFDFVAGRDVVFYDDFTGYPVKTKPTRWQMVKHNQANYNKAWAPQESYVTVIDGIPCFYGKSSASTSKLGTPTWNASDYGNACRSEYWSVEFDFMFLPAETKQQDTVRGNAIGISMDDVDDYFDLSFETFRYLPPGTAHMTSFYSHAEDEPQSMYVKYPGLIKDRTWHHFSAAFKRDSISTYIDNRKVLTFPVFNYYMPNLTVIGNDVAIKNFKLAYTNPNAPAGNTPEQLLTETKFTTHAINFDKNKAIIKPESMTFVTQLADFLKANVGMKLEIDGHTDSDGEPEANMELSRKRAEAIKTQLVKMGVKPERLATKGFGATVPIETNATPEGMAQNRRVEFVKQ